MPGGPGTPLRIRCGLEVLSPGRMPPSRAHELHEPPWAIRHPGSEPPRYSPQSRAPPRIRALLPQKTTVPSNQMRKVPQTLTLPSLPLKTNLNPRGTLNRRCREVTRAKYIYLRSSQMKRPSPSCSLKEKGNRKTVTRHRSSETGGNGFPQKNAAVQGTSAPNTVLYPQSIPQPQGNVLQSERHKSRGAWGAQSVEHLTSA